jgi:hypothetical protein
MLVERGIRPDRVVDDGTYHYQLDGEGVSANTLDTTLDVIDSDWRDHVENWRDS